MGRRLSDDIARLADTVLDEWGEPFSCSSARLEDAVGELYRNWLEFPPSWPAHRCEAFIATHADRDAGDLATVFDDLIDSTINEFGLSCGVVPLADDAAELIDAARRRALDRLLTSRLILALPEAIAQSQRFDPGRGNGSMTSCGSRAASRRQLRLPGT